MIKIGIVEDNRDLRQNLIQVLELLGEFELVLEASDGREAVLNMEEIRDKPALILMDIEMRDMDGIAATRLIKEKYPEVKILMLSVFDGDDNIQNAFSAGADGYLLKDERPLRIHQLIKDTLEGRMSMSPEIASKAINMLRKKGNEVRLKPEDFGLSAREMQVLQQLTLGKSHPAIAASLFISPKTVRSHLEHIYQKMDVHSKIEASNLAIRNRWFD